MKKYKLSEPLEIPKKRTIILLAEATLKRSFRANDPISKILRASKLAQIYGQLQHEAYANQKKKKTFAGICYHKNKVTGKERYAALIEIDFEMLSKKLNMKRSTLDHNMRELRKLGAIERIRRGLYLMGIYNIHVFENKEGVVQDTIGIDWKFDYKIISRVKKIIKKL